MPTSKMSLPYWIGLCKFKTPTYWIIFRPHILIITRKWWSKVNFYQITCSDQMIQTTVVLNTYQILWVPQNNSITCNWATRSRTCIKPTITNLRRSSPITLEQWQQITTWDNNKKEEVIVRCLMSRPKHLAALWCQQDHTRVFKPVTLESIHMTPKPMASNHHNKIPEHKML